MNTGFPEFVLNASLSLFHLSRCLFFPIRSLLLLSRPLLLINMSRLLIGRYFLLLRHWLSIILEFILKASLSPRYFDVDALNIQSINIKRALLQTPKSPTNELSKDVKRARQKSPTTNPQQRSLSEIHSECITASTSCRNRTLLRQRGVARSLLLFAIGLFLTAL